MNFFSDNDRMPFNPGIDEDTDFIPLLSIEDEDNMQAEKLPDVLPILPLRNTVLFPGVVIPITVGRDNSIALIKESYKGDRTIGVVSQKSDAVEEPNYEDLNNIGTVAHIIKMLRMPDGNTTVIIQGKKRFKIKEFIQSEPFHKAAVEAFDEIKPPKNDKEFQAIISNLKEISHQIIKQSPNIPTEATFAIKNIESPAFLVNFIASNLSSELEKKQQLLEMNNIGKRIEGVIEQLSYEIKMISMKNEIQSKVKMDIDRQQREYFLNQQMRTIQDELGDNPVQNEINEFEKRAKLNI